MKRALFVLLAACSAPAVHHETIHVTRTQGDVQAPGDATVTGQAARSPHVKLAAARAWLAVSLASHDADAYAAAKAGLAELGDDYAPKSAIDDTDNLVKIAALETDPAKAAVTARKALVDRIAMYLRRYHGAVE